MLTLAQQKMRYLPAAYLQPPNFFPNADDAVNYGAKNANGHEISHAFDDKGSQFDGTNSETTGGLKIEKYLKKRQSVLLISIILNYSRQFS